VAVDSQERLISINRAGGTMLGVTSEAARGRAIQEVVRNPGMQAFVSRVLSEAGPVEGDVTLVDPSGERFLQVHGAVLRDAQGSRIGAVIVLNDVTRLRRLENLRREFVANVSHELKTPITSIKGYVETLLDGALKNPQESEKFLGVVARHADRLNSIIEDLLLLSRIEQDAEKSTLETEDARLRDVFAEAADACAARSIEKGIRIDIDCPDDMAVPLNVPLMRQAVVNLIDNAVKYSEPGTTVRIEGSRVGDEVVISVCDRGCGIDKEHLARLGERFYRVDTARSRQQGGTGLGLAIVKHIAQAHGGRLSVESAPGQGSVFRIHLRR
jgi:two-component system phosphate regulon sensor histidine kinase PhoR